MRNRSPYPYDNGFHSNTTSSSHDTLSISMNKEFVSRQSEFYPLMAPKPTMVSTVTPRSSISTSRIKKKRTYETEKGTFVEKVFRFYFARVAISLFVGLLVFYVPKSKHYTTTSSISRLLRSHTAVAARDIRIDEIQHKIDSFSDSIDAIIVGSGLGGLTTMLQLLDRGANVVLVEKNSYLGGNSNKASSGINSCCSKNESNGFSDSIDLFMNDTIKSGGVLSRHNMIETLVSNSDDALQWLRHRVNVDLSMIGQLGGHSVPRTYRPTLNTVGIEMIYRLQLLIRHYEQSGQALILLNTQVTQLLHDNDHHHHVNGVQCIIRDNDVSTTLTAARTIQIRASNVVLATGGFASSADWLKKYRPDLLSFPTTAGSFSTGDGITLATTLNDIDITYHDDNEEQNDKLIKKSASLIHMDQIQLHPTGFIHPTNTNSRNKVLAAEILRGVGGILINQSGQRFCNELGTRDYVSNQMLSQQKENPIFYLVLSSTAANQAKKHVDMYTRQGLLTQVYGIEGIANYMNKGVVPADVGTMWHDYYTIAMSGNADSFGKIYFHGLPPQQSDDLIRFINTDTYYIGMVTPVIHYCMGGIEIDTTGNVVDVDGNKIHGLYGVGEVTGGVHGKNRLGGNSLLECVVFGSIIGKTSIDVPTTTIHRNNDHGKVHDNVDNISSSRFLRIVLYSELSRHNQPNDCWIAIHGIVYNVTEMAKVHPGGSEHIYQLAGTDATQIFDAMHRHSDSLLVGQNSLLNARIGRLIMDEDDAHINHDIDEQQVSTLPKMSLRELKNKQDKGQQTRSCYVALYGVVYDLAHFVASHPAGSEVILQLAGTDGTEIFQTVHKKHMLDAFQKHRIAVLVNDDDAHNNESEPQSQQQERHKESISTMLSSYLPSSLMSVLPFMNHKSQDNSSNTKRNKIPVRSVSTLELREHHQNDDCWVIIDGMVYNVTSFIPLHIKGGSYQIIKNCGKDITITFRTIHHNRQLATSFVNSDYFQKLQIGPVAES